MRSFTIMPNDAGQRLDKFLTKALPLLPQALLYKGIRLKRIKLNGKRCEISTRLVVGDVLELYINDEFFALPDDEFPFLQAKPQIDVLYEDEYVLLVNKAPGLVVHEDENGSTDTLINRILHYLYQKGEYNPQEEQSFAPALCNRIDRNTGGIVLAAKTAEALRILNEKIKERQLRKFYLCVVFGTPAKKNELLKAWLLKDSYQNQVAVFSAPQPEAKTILTKYKTLQTSGRFSLLEVELLTGRTHQIRAHMAFVGHPLLGDTKYGHNRDNKGLGYKYQALCAYKVCFEFSSPGGILEYLNGKCFAVPEGQIPFVQQLRQGKIV